MRIVKVGYDLDVVWSPEELEAMYLSEGKRPEEAKQLSETLSREMSRMTSRQRYSWRKCRRHEITGFDMNEMEAD